MEKYIKTVISKIRKMKFHVKLFEIKRKTFYLLFLWNSFSQMKFNMAANRIKRHFCVFFPGLLYDDDFIEISWLMIVVFLYRMVFPLSYRSFIFSKEYRLNAQQAEK